MNTEQMKEWLNYRLTQWENGQTAMSFSEWLRHPEHAPVLTADPISTVNGLETELHNVSHQYAEQSAALAQLQKDNQLLTKLITNIHLILNRSGVPNEGSLIERVQKIVKRMQKTERRHRRAVKTALMYRRRWLDACAEIEAEV